MARSARKRSASGIYHIMIRGADKRIIFADDDCKYFISVLERVQERSGFDLYAWCLMGNHVHLLLREGKEPLEETRGRFSVSSSSVSLHQNVFCLPAGARQQNRPPVWQLAPFGDSKLAE